MEIAIDSRSIFYTFYAFITETDSSGEGVATIDHLNTPMHCVNVNSRNLLSSAQSNIINDRADWSVSVSGQNLGRNARKTAQGDVMAL